MNVNKRKIVTICCVRNIAVFHVQLNWIRKTMIETNREIWTQWDEANKQRETRWEMIKIKCSILNNDRLKNVMKIYADNKQFRKHNSSNQRIVDVDNFILVDSRSRAIAPPRRCVLLLFTSIYRVGQTSVDASERDRKVTTTQSR